MNEIWKPVVGYEGLYEVSSLWRIKSLIDNHWTFRNKILTSSVNMYWYCRCSLFKDKIQKTLLVHRLVCNTFMLNTENKKEVNHINWIKTDNRLDNLEWCTSSENKIHAYKTLGKIPPHLWKYQWNHPASKKIIQISKKWYKITEWDSLISVESFTWINRKWISDCCCWKIKSSGWFIWKYL